MSLTIFCIPNHNYPNILVVIQQYIHIYLTRQSNLNKTYCLCLELVPYLITFAEHTINMIETKLCGNLEDHPYNWQGECLTLYLSSCSVFHCRSWPSIKSPAHVNMQCSSCSSNTLLVLGRIRGVYFIVGICSIADLSIIIGNNYSVKIPYNSPLQCIRANFRHSFRLIIPGVCLAQFSLNNVHKRGLKHHHFISSVSDNETSLNEQYVAMDIK